MTLKLTNVLDVKVAEFGSIVTPNAVNPVSLSDAGKVKFENDFQMIPSKGFKFQNGDIKIPAYNHYQELVIPNGKSITLDITDSAEILYYKGLAADGVLTVTEA